MTSQLEHFSASANRVELEFSASDAHTITNGIDLQKKKC